MIVIVVIIVVVNDNGCRTKENKIMVEYVDDVVSFYQHHCEDMMEQQIHDQEVFGMIV